MTHFLALDQGTSSSRAIVFDDRGTVVAGARREIDVHYPHAGWVEQDAMDIWTSQRDSAVEALGKAGIDVARIAGIGIANQRETTVVWDRNSGKPIAPAIVWQDQRGAARCEELSEQGVARKVRAMTGLRIDAYFSATKIAWILDHVDGARARADKGELAFGTVDSWLLWNLTQGRVHATDVTNASRTLLLDIETLDWDDGLLDLFDIPRRLLPEVRPSAGHFGNAVLAGGKAPVTGVAGDQPAALFGQRCRRKGQAKNTYGTGAFVLMHTGHERCDVEGLVTGPVCRLPGDDRAYGLEGSIFVAGALVQWLRDGLGLIKASGDIEALAAEVPDAGGVSIVPALTGLGAPFWDAAARGTILGLTRGTTAAHIARASLEAIAWRTRDVIEAMQTVLDKPVATLRVDGGAARDDLLLQIQADVLGVPIVRPADIETTAMGAAMLAAAGAEAVDADGLDAWWQAGHQFEPGPDADTRDERYRTWQRACERARQWALDDAP